MRSRAEVSGSGGPGVRRSGGGEFRVRVRLMGRAAKETSFTDRHVGTSAAQESHERPGLEDQDGGEGQCRRRHVPQRGGVTVAEMETNSTPIVTWTSASKNGRRAGMSNPCRLPTASPMTIRAISLASSRRMSQAAAMTSTTTSCAEVPSTSSSLSLLSSSRAATRRVGPMNLRRSRHRGSRRRGSPPPTARPAAGRSHRATGWG